MNKNNYYDELLKEISKLLYNLYCRNFITNEILIKDLFCIADKMIYDQLNFLFCHYIESFLEKNKIESSKKAIYFLTINLLERIQQEKIENLLILYKLTFKV